jgi:hypothetical protein
VPSLQQPKKTYFTGPAWVKIPATTGRENQSSPPCRPDAPSGSRQNKQRRKFTPKAFCFALKAIRFVPSSIRFAPKAFCFVLKAIRFTPKQIRFAIKQYCFTPKRYCFARPFTQIAASGLRVAKHFYFSSLAPKKH